jgi:hypothetical protein
MKLTSTLINALAQKIWKFFLKKKNLPEAILLEEYQLRGIRVSLFKSRIKNENIILESKLPINFKSTFIKHLLIKLKYKVGRKELSEFISEQKASILTPGQWNELSMYVIGYAYFTSAYEARLKSYEAFESKNTRRALGPLYHNYQVRRQFETTGWKINIYGRPSKPHILIGFQDDYMDLLVYGKYPLKSVQGYLELIKDKKIAILGPLKLSTMDRDEISQFDIVVLANNFSAAEELLNIDKVYYLSKVVFEENIDFLNNLKDCSIKYIVTKINDSINLYEGAVPLRLRKETRNLTWNGAFNFIQNIILDLLLYRPKEIKVFGSDLYFTLDYDKSYKREVHQVEKYLTHSFTNHDVITQFLFTKKLFDNGYILADARLEKILRMQLRDYLSGMEKIYALA